MSKVQDTPSFLLLHRFSSSDYAELTEHSCFTDYARNLNGFGLTAIGLAHSHSSFRGIATTARSSFRLKSVSNPRKAVKVPFILRNPMNGVKRKSKEDILQDKIFNSQLEQYVNTEDCKVAVLNAFPIFLFDSTPMNMSSCTDNYQYE